MILLNHVGPYIHLHKCSSIMFTLHRRLLITFEEYMLMITCNHNFFHIKDELLSRKKREKKKKTGGKTVDVSKLGASEKNERWEHKNMFIIQNCFKIRLQCDPTSYVYQFQKYQYLHLYSVYKRLIMFHSFKKQNSDLKHKFHRFFSL